MGKLNVTAPAQKTADSLPHSTADTTAGDAGQDGPLPAVVLIGHGSLRSASGAAMIRIAARLRAEGIADQIEPAFLNFSRPTLADALQRCAENGARHVHVQPYFLIAGAYVQQDLPQLLETTLAKFPGLTASLAPAFGYHPALVDLAYTRLAAAAPELAQPASTINTGTTNTGERGLLLMAHGTPIAAANAPLAHVLADLLRRTGIAHGRVAFLDCNTPDIPEGIAELAQAGVQRLITLPYFLHLGRHVREDLPQLVAQARTTWPQIEFRAAQHLDYDLRLVDVIRDRLDAIAEPSATLIDDQGNR
ncbi:MAG: sirohydrochlorin chelatase [Litorilinea sp.]